MLEKLKQNKFWWFQGPMILWALALFGESSVPGERIPDFSFLSHDKVIHFCIYVVFAWTINRGIANQDRFPLLKKYHYLFTLLLVSVYGASDEFHQYFVPGRQCDVFDWLADTSGGALYIAAHWVWKKLRSVSVSA